MDSEHPEIRRGAADRSFEEIFHLEILRKVVTAYLRDLYVYPVLFGPYQLVPLSYEIMWNTLVMLLV